MITIINKVKSLFSDNSKEIKNEIKWRATKADCENSSTPDVYCDSEKPFISNY